MKKFILTIAMLTVSLSASAQWVAGGGYGNLSDELELSDEVDELDVSEVSLGMIYGSIGYLIEGEGNFIFLPELRLGLGISDYSASVYGVGLKLEMDSVVAFSVRGQYTFDSGFYLFANPSFSRFAVTASAGNESVSEDDWEFGFGGGAGYKFTQQLWGELAYEAYDGLDVLGFGFKYLF